MTFEAKQMIASPIRAGRTAKARYDFAKLASDANLSIVIPAAHSDLFAHCRSMASMFNRTSKIKIKCSKQYDGSMLVFADRQTFPPDACEDFSNGDTLPVSKVKSAAPEPIVSEILPAKSPVLAILKAIPEDYETKPAAKELIPTKQQFCDWLLSLAVGTRITLNHEYMLRFAEFEMYVCELNGFDSETVWNPPQLIITRKG